jgi:hypothetical protein
VKAFLAAVVMVGLLVGTARGAPPPSVYRDSIIAQHEQRKATAARVVLESDARLAKVADARPQKIGILTYYPNRGGGFTFREGATIVLYALPYLPTTRDVEKTLLIIETTSAGIVIPHHPKQWQSVSAIGTSKLPFGGQAIYQPEMFTTGKNVLCREDVQVGSWTRDTPNGKLRLSIMAKDNETRMKLKSIVPVLERAEHAR